MVKWSSLSPQLDQQPTTPAIRGTFSAMETALALVKLMECGLGAHPLVNVSEHVIINVKHQSIRVTMGPAFLISIVSLYFIVFMVAWTLTTGCLSETRTRTSLLLTLTVYTPSS